MKTKAILLVLSLSFFSFAFAQVGTIQGTVYDSEKNTIPGATVEITSGISYVIVASDIDGNFKLKPLEPGTYSITIKSMGMHPLIINDINVRPNQISFVDKAILKSDAVIIDGSALVVGNDERLVDPENTSKMPINRDVIKRLPGSKNAVDIAVSLSTDISKDENNQMIIRGSRPGSSNVYIDGVKLESNGAGGVPSLAIGDMEIYTGGVPAKYGDFTGGIVIMRTASYFDLLNEHEARQRRFEELAAFEVDQAAIEEESETKDK